MDTYTVQTWILLFFTYSFLGWIWESCYVSAKERKWVNRGFLYSPMLPIYGFGALTVLVSTLRVQNNLYLVYIMGAIGATLLELATGYLMEMLFKTKYWDYSYKKYHYKGYICISSTVAWGFFSIIMIRYINVPVETFILGLGSTISEIILIVLVIIFSVDVTKSVQNALDLKELLETMAKNNEHINSLINEMETLAESFEDNKEELVNDLKQQIGVIRKDVKNHEHIYVEKISDFKGNLDIRLKLTNTFDRLSESLKYFDDNENQDRDINSELSNRDLIRNEIRELKSRIEERRANANNLELRRFRGAINQLKRNSTAKSRKMNDELEKIKKL